MKTAVDQFRVIKALEEDVVKMAEKHYGGDFTPESIEVKEAEHF